MRFLSLRGTSMISMCAHTRICGICHGQDREQEFECIIPRAKLGAAKNVIEKNSDKPRTSP